MYKDIEKQELPPWENALFRAKAKHTGIWVTGCLVVFEKGALCPKQAFIIPQMESVCLEPISGTRTIGGFIEVEPATICRFAGLYDKFGKMIFEKDIVKNHMGFRQVVHWYMGTFVFRSELDYIYKEWQSENFCACQKKFEIAEACVTADEIVGNIFDDEEFLEYFKEAKEENEKYEQGI
jgi:uncharacterized phage protein (TIGR01671 family)